MSEHEVSQEARYATPTSFRSSGSVQPEYDDYDRRDPDAPGYRIKVVRDFEDMAKVHVIRASGTFDDPEYYYDKQFDGSDFSCTHLLGYIDGEPVGTIRIRYFADFTRIERLTIRPTYRKSRMAFKLARAAFAWCREKGYKRLSGVARAEMVPFWSLFGGEVTASRDPIFIYGLPHFEMHIEFPPHPSAISTATETMVLLRPEGRWHEAGYHETKNATAPVAVAKPRTMLRSARRPADIAERMAERREGGSVTFRAPLPPPATSKGAGKSSA